MRENWVFLLEAVADWRAYIYINFSAKKPNSPKLGKCKKRGNSRKKRKRERENEIN